MTPISALGSLDKALARAVFAFVVTAGGGTKENAQKRKVTVKAAVLICNATMDTCILQWHVKVVIASVMMATI